MNLEDGVKEFKKYFYLKLEMNGIKLKIILILLKKK